VESPLDAVRLFGLGIPAIASLGAWVSAEQVALMARCFAAVYVALDNPAIDKAGRDGAEQVTTMLRRRRCAAIPWRYEGLVDEDGNPAKDPGDVASDDALLEAWASTQRWGL
jgi:DNA primase